MTRKSLLEQAHDYVLEVWDDIERDIDELIRVESVEDLSKAGPGMPFGPGPRKALDTALTIAERLGLSTNNCDGYVGFADVAGSDDGYIATIAHSDIVPVGSGWSVDPLRLTKKDGYLLGRGVLDDKGPLVLSLYAAHFVKRLAEKSQSAPSHTLRCIVGTNEETNMQDVEYYLEHYPQPLFCFTPDANFPLICGEKGRVYAEICHTPTSDARIVSIDGGDATNAITGRVEAVVVARFDELPSCEGIDISRVGSKEQGGELVRISAVGKGGHAAMPEEAHSAVGVLCRYLLDCGVYNEDERGFLECLRLLYDDCYGRGLGVDATDTVFDPLTCSGTKIATLEDEGKTIIAQGVDIRFPSSTTSDELGLKLASVAQAHGCVARVCQSSVPFLTDPDSKEVRTLLGAYSDVCGRVGKPFTIGGGTYARHFDKAVAFGPVDEALAPNPSWVGPEHGPDEGVLCEQLQRALETYVVALVRLLGMD